MSIQLGNVVEKICRRLTVRPNDAVWQSSLPPETYRATRVFWEVLGSRLQLWESTGERVFSYTLVAREYRLCVV